MNLLSGRVLIYYAAALFAAGIDFAESSSGTDMFFRPVQTDEDEDARRLGGRKEGSTWGSFAEDCDEYCLFNNHKGKIKFGKCDEEKEKQQFRFTEDYTKEEYFYGGQLLSRVDKKCLEIQGSIKIGARVETSKCDKRNKKQQWVSDGDMVNPRSRKNLCLYHEDGFDADFKMGDPAVLVKCKNAESLNFSD